MADATFELLTPRGALGGVAVVAVRGVDRVDAVARWLDDAPARRLRERAEEASSDRLGSPLLADLRIGGDWLDQALVVVRPASIELHLHGSEAVLRALEAHCGVLERPVLDPVERLLIDAADPAELALAIEQRRLCAAESFEQFCDRLAAEARDSRAEARAKAQAEWSAATARGAIVQAMREPTPVVLVGAQNAGKSTLLNVLLMAQRALVGPVPGLTRDPVAASTTLCGYRYEWIDTAGERASEAQNPTASGAHAAIDAQAIDAARRQRRRADALRLVVLDGSAALPVGIDRWLEAVPEPRWFVRTKADLPAASWSEPVADLAVECVSAQAPARVRSQVGEWLRKQRGLPIAGAVGGVAPLDAEQRARLAAVEPE